MGETKQHWSLPAISHKRATLRNIPTRHDGRLPSNQLRRKDPISIHQPTRRTKQIKNATTRTAHSRTKTKEEGKEKMRKKAKKSTTHPRRIQSRPSTHNANKNNIKNNKIITQQK